MPIANTPILDALIIGGGPAGLSAASGLARQLYTAVVFDSGVYRNEKAGHMHNVITWDHQDPAVFRKKARDDLLKRYSTIKFQDDTKIESVERTSEGGFQATDTQGRTWIGWKLVLATGVRDIYPDMDGYGECWGVGIFHCLFCHGYEDHGCASAGVLAVGIVGNPAMAVHLAHTARRFTPNVTIYTDGAEELGEKVKLALKDNKFKVDTRRVVRLEKASEKAEVILHLGDGTEIREGFLVHKPNTEINGPFAQQLSLEVTETGDIKTSQPFYESSVSGVFAVGDCGTAMKAVTQAMVMGTLGAVGAANQMQAVPTHTV